MKYLFVALFAFSTPAFAVTQSDIDKWHHVTKPQQQFVVPVNTTTMCPDGSYVAGTKCTMCPDSTYVGGSRCVMTPDGKYVGGN
jgi:hypothetical protein